MRKAILAASAALVGMGIVSAHAADLHSGSLKDAAAVQTFGQNWSGLYVGGSAGFGVGDTSDNLNTRFETALSYYYNLNSANFDLGGMIYGLHAGYNWQRGSLVYGLEASLNGTGLDGSWNQKYSYDGESGYGTDSLTVKRKLDWYTTAVGRLGYAQGNTLFYGFGGLAWGKVKTTATGGYSYCYYDEGCNSYTDTYRDSSTHLGWTAGLGMERAFSDRFSARVEYSHVDLGSADIFDGLDKVDMKFDAVKVGASYKLFGDRAVEPLK